MSGVAVAASALLWYVWVESSGVLLVGGVAIVALALCGLLVSTGIYLGHSAPAATRWLLAFWSIGVVAIAGVIAALLSDLSTDVVAGEGATDSAKTTAALATATLVVVGTHANSWLPQHMSPWLARRIFGQRYREPYFPCLPIEELKHGVAAYKKLEAACTGELEEWTGRRLQDLLELIRVAIAAEECHQGPTWRCRK